MNEEFERTAYNQENVVKIRDSYKLKGFTILSILGLPLLILIFIIFHSEELTYQMKLWRIIILVIFWILGLLIETKYGISHLFRTREFLISNEKIMLNLPVKVKEFSEDGVYHYEVKWKDLKKIELRKCYYKKHENLLFFRKYDQLFQFYLKNDKLEQVNIGSSDFHNRKIMKIIENVKRYAHSKNIRLEKKEGLVEIVSK